MTVVATDRAKDGFLLGKDEGEAHWLLGMLEVVKISGADTGGAFGLLEVTVRAGEGSPWHVHPDEDEWFYVLEGEMTFWVGGNVIVAPAGAFVYGPRDIPHTFDVTSDVAHFLLVAEPGGFDQFMRAAGEPAGSLTIPPPPSEPPDPERLATVAAEYGIEILGPPGIPA